MIKPVPPNWMEFQGSIVIGYGAAISSLVLVEIEVAISLSATVQPSARAKNVKKMNIFLD
ncbi:MAG: hypothetical protein QM396_06700 [Euryarchaeota archaeon]|jgi:hypothetical protein|nr:hypothetical protein [Euryarchaeota archaeon]HHT18040.1 hypothetical protein [Methanobacterium sp.]